MAEKTRFIGFDLLRAYAIFGMYIVNFNMVFGDHNDTSWQGQFLSLFSGNSSTIFVMLAGMGLILMTKKQAFGTAEEQLNQKYIALKRAGFLFALGILLAIWWPADILHFYGFYMFIASFFLFRDKKQYIYGAIIFAVIFHLLLLWIPYETGWNFDTLEYKDMWTLSGFIRNSFYNGWNAVFPWMSYFITGMYLAKLDWSDLSIQRKTFAIGLVLYLLIQMLQCISKNLMTPEIDFFLNADYLPPFLPFLISTIGFGLMLIASFMYISKFIAQNKFANDLAKTGQMTLTHYISHLTIGLVFFSFMINQGCFAKINAHKSLSPMLIFIISLLYFACSYYFSKLWAKRFKHGPFELLLRKISA
ncbi:DUF418 domain-containing protein [Sphingobacterium sp. ML3W]|uniref:DUF418 domain-containing protein n=1 Tax=Sphingobacterium sp. ML3W TaxID=1538644 RepID=UPI00249C601E|nr:DUF418 domain-containing protein [Sphingobacterium sp. ML3W]WFA81636.1 DUF418 domain-containing protein [Sphingobacterium sp. ML3W]